MPSYVIVWENNTPGHRKVPDRIWEGHAAINIGGKLHPGAAYWDSFVSWFPKDDLPVDERPGHLFSGGQAGKSTSFMHDVWFEGYLPDHVVKLASDPDKEAKMRAEWGAINKPQGGSLFHLARHNCSTVVSRVLHAGGYYAFKWAIDNNLFWTPADVPRLAHAAGGKSMEWEDFVEVLRVSGIMPEHLIKQNTTRRARGGGPPREAPLTSPAPPSRHPPRGPAAGRTLASACEGLRSPTSPYPIPEKIMAWDVEKATKHLQDHAGPPYGVGKCATFVREAIEAGGLIVSRAGSGSAKDYGPRLTGAGFVAQTGEVTVYQKGDVAVIDGFAKDAKKGVTKDAPHGHLAMSDGTRWISDFKQDGAKPYPGSRYVKAAPKITISRHL